MNVFALTLTLSRLTDEIRAEANKYLVAPPPAHTSENDMVRVKIQRWIAQLRQVEAQLKSKAHFARMQYDQARFTANRYSAGQRYGSTNANIERVRSHLNDAIRALSDLIDALNPNFEQAVLELLKELTEQANTLAKPATSDEVFFQAPASQNVTATIQQYVEPFSPPDTPQGGGVFAIFYALCFLTIGALALRKRL